MSVVLGPERPSVRPRRRLWPWVAGVGLVVASAAVWAVHSPWLSVGEIEILGADRADVAGEVASAGVGEGAIMIWVDTAEIEQAIFADPWVRDVRVDRVFPDRLVVEVLERSPAVWIEGASSWMLVADDGTVVQVSGEPDRSVLQARLAAPDRIPGDRPEEPTWDEIVGMAMALEPGLASSAAVYTEGSELWLEVPGHAVRLGAPVDLADKALVLQELLTSGDLPFGAVIDLVAPRRPAVILPGGVVPSAEVEGEGDGEAAPGG